MYKHFILTRFNLKLHGISGFETYNLPEQTEEWLERRFSLFEKYCFPSIMNQTCKNFIWFVLFSSSTPPRFTQRIKNYELQFPLFKPLFLDASDSGTIKRNLNKAIIPYCDSGINYLITSRIDNDDAYHKDMVFEVQKLFNKQENVFISFSYGLQYDIDQKIFARMHHENNHFISRIEKLSDNIETVIAPDHTHIDKISKVIYINNKKKPMWLEILHGGNLINTLYPSSFPLFCNNTKVSFNFEESISTSNTLLMLMKYLKVKAKFLATTFLVKSRINYFLKKNSKKSDKEA